MKKVGKIVGIRNEIISNWEPKSTEYSSTIINGMNEKQNTIEAILATFGLTIDLFFPSGPMLGFTLKPGF